MRMDFFTPKLLKPSLRRNFSKFITLSKTRRFFYELLVISLV
ncbi:MAG: hypothetical protein JW976_01855 [Syntrophaceae bacterium]|nr:hypothetical protein [Syntrophaceae bacterium]